MNKSDNNDKYKEKGNTIDNIQEKCLSFKQDLNSIHETNSNKVLRMLQMKKLDSKHSIRSGSITKNKTQEFSFRDQKKEKQLNCVNENCSDDQFNNITNANLQFKFEKLKKSKQSTKFNAI